ncbi:recombinase family protein [Flavobacterium celericrescens]
MRNNLMGKNVLGYIRVSTKDQKDFGHSLSSQNKAIANYCDCYQMNVVEFFEEDYSAKNFNRPVFKELKDYAKKNKGKIDYLIVQKWDRFSRNVGLALQMIEYFKKLGIEVNCVENWIDYNASDYIILLSLYLSTPEAENSKIRDRTIAGTREALKQGRYVNSQPIGYISGRDERDKTLMKPDPIVAPLVKKLFEDYSTGLYTQQDLLKKYKVKGLKIERSALSRLLENPLYMGMVKVPAYKDEPEMLVEGLHIPLISKETFYIVQGVKNGRTNLIKKLKGKNDNFPLTSFLTCPECGQVLYGSQSNNGKSKKVTRTYNYYQCNSKHTCKRYRVEIIHNKLELALQNIKPAKEVLELFEKILIDEYKNVKTDRLKDINDLDKKIADIGYNQMMLTEKFGLDKIKEEVYNKLMDCYEKEMIDLKAAKAELGDYQHDLDKYVSFGLSLLTNLSEFYKNAGVEVKTKLLGSIFSNKLEFFENSFRTLPFNEAISLIGNYNKALGRNKNKKGSSQLRTSLTVPGVGIEPTHLSTRV